MAHERRSTPTVVEALSFAISWVLQSSGQRPIVGRRRTLQA